MYLDSAPAPRFCFRCWEKIIIYEFNIENWKKKKKEKNGERTTTSSCVKCFSTTVYVARVVSVLFFSASFLLLCPYLFYILFKFNQLMQIECCEAEHWILTKYCLFLTLYTQIFYVFSSTFSLLRSFFSFSLSVSLIRSVLSCSIELFIWVDFFCSFWCFIYLHYTNCCKNENTKWNKLR